MTASIFAKLREHLARFGGDAIPLHIGDTHLPPAVALDAFDWQNLPQSELYAYGAPPGWTPLVDTLVAKLRRKNGISDASPATLQITAGATHALACAVQALCDPGDELILVTPHWPLIRGIAIGHHVRPVEVALSAVASAVSAKTVGIYVASPNNPDGAMLSPADVEQIVQLARERDLWIFSDEVYEDYVYDGAHVSIAPRAPERTVTVFSCSKGYAQAGLRVGYVVGPEPVIEAVKKLANHSVFNVPVAMQRAAHAAITGGDAFLAAARDRYRGARDRARSRLVAPAELPPGAAYLWVDFGAWCGNGDCMPVLERIAAAGVLVAPGSAFGDACGRFARLCFTGVAEDRLDEGIDRINRVL